MPTLTMEQAYRPIRNRLRRLHPRSTVELILRLLQQLRGDDIVHDLRHAPWLHLLLVKWTCQDSMAGMQSVRNATRDDIFALAQSLWELPGRLDAPAQSRLIMRQILGPQLRFQYYDRTSLIREAAILLTLPDDHRLRRQFEMQSGLTLHALIDLSLAVIGRLEVQNNWTVPEGYFQPFERPYSATLVENFRNCISRDFAGLTAFFGSLPDARRKRKSELFEFPVISRYPFYRSNGRLVCWHPAVAYHGMGHFVHSILAQSVEDGVSAYGKAFEIHVTSVARSARGEVYDEGDLRGMIPDGEKTPDVLISTPECNIFVEAKSGVFGENIMASGNAEILQDKLAAVNHAVLQGWSASHWLRASEISPAQIREATTDFLLIVTNKELILGNGARLSQLYGEPIEIPESYSNGRLAIERVYIMAIEDFERLMLAEELGEISLPDFLSQCVSDDSEATSARLLMEQHLTSDCIPRRSSTVVSNELDRALERAEQFLHD